MRSQSYAPHETRHSFYKVDDHTHPHYLTLKEAPVAHSFKDLQDGLPTQQYIEAQEKSEQLIAEVEVEDLTSEAQEIEQHLLTSCREAISEHGVCRPVVAALVGLELQIFHPDWTTARQKDEEFYHINNYLEDQYPSITVAALPGKFGEEGSPDPAIILVTRTRAWKSMKIYPYQVSEDNVRWLEPVEAETFETNILRVPRLD